MEEYERLRDVLKKRFEDERTGEQSLYIDQSRILKPLIDEQKETKKNITKSQDAITNTLVPFMAELKKRNDQVEDLQSLPFYRDYPQIEAISHSTPKRDTSGIVMDLDKMLNDSDRENLQDMSLPLPSAIINKGNYNLVLEHIKTLNRQYGQFTGKRSKKDDREKEIYRSRQTTLDKYSTSLEEQMKALKYRTGEGLRTRKMYKIKRGKGRPKKYPDTKYYNSPDDLLQELNKLVTAKEAGHTGLDNNIVSALDTLLEIKAINKKEYDNIYKKYIV